MLKKYLKTACVFLMGAVLALNLLTMALSGMGLREQLNWLPGALLTVDSGSMEPVLSEGDLLIVWETPYDRLEVGDLVTFHGNNELITHEIIREEGDRFVTQGAANNAEDSPIGPEEYCAKVAYVLPGAGRLLDTLTDPGKLALAVALVVSLFYGPSVVLWLASVLAKEEKKRFQVRPLRLMGVGTMISLLCITPFMTAAKYAANVNEYGSVNAGATYFTSNYLSEEGNTYYIEGWQGAAYGMPLYVRNYANDLLFNKDGYDLDYQISYEILSQSPDNAEIYETCYTVELYDSAGQNQYEMTNGTSKKFTIMGDSDEWHHDHFEISVQTDPDVTLVPQDKIRFRIMVSTIGDTDFDRELMGDFTFVVASAKDFLGEHGYVDKAGSSLVTYQLKTELVQGGGTRDVVLTWNNQKLYLNEYEDTVANIIANDPNHTQYIPDDGNGKGSLTMSLHAYSNVNLQFFKYDSKTTIVPADFTCKEVKPTGS